MLATMFNMEDNSIELKGETYVVTAKDFTEIMRIEDDEEEIKMPWRGQNTPPPTQLKKDCKERTLTIFVKRFLGAIGARETKSVDTPFHPNFLEL
ncbi:hypothetical protein Tco_1300718 [Tanacetum coccineum]